MKNNYAIYSRFGPNTYSQTRDPLSYIVPGENIDQQFLHGSSAIGIDGQHSRQSQAYMSQYCADKWDGFCELLSRNQSASYPNQLHVAESTGQNPVTDAIPTNLRYSAGEILVLNTAKEKYLKTMGNCYRRSEPYDPTVANSPLVSFWENGYGLDGVCVPQYAVDPKTVDSDPVMMKLLAMEPIKAKPVLLNIFNTMRQEGTLPQLQGTKLGEYFNIVYKGINKNGNLSL